MLRAKLCGNHLGYPATEHPANIAAWFQMRMNRWPTEIIYPADHPPQIDAKDRKKLRQDFGVRLLVSNQRSPLALAGPFHVE